MNMPKANQATTNIGIKTLAFVLSGLTNVLHFVLISTTSDKSAPIPVTRREPKSEKVFMSLKASNSKKEDYDETRKD